MSRNRHSFRFSRLGIQILLYFLLAAAVGAGLYFTLSHFSDSFIIEHFDNEQALQGQTAREIASFQDYVTANGLSTGDAAKINAWIYGEKYALMHIYKDNYLVDSYPTYVKGVKKLRPDESELNHRLYNVDFKNGTAQVEIYLLAASRYYNFAEIAELLIAFACFILIFLLLISTKFRYINTLQKEMKIIEGGDLEHPVTVRGNDEIAMLASGLDQMRISFAERIKSEKEARRANSELITSMSHDLRTPLTILIGDLDLIADKKYKTEEQFNRYIENSRRKAYRLKELSDRLFEYFLVLGSERQEPEMETVSCSEHIYPLIAEYTLSLADQGFIIESGVYSDDFAMKVNLIAVRRVFDNLFNNVMKYASRTEPVTISYEKSDTFFSVTVSNGKGNSPLKTDSTKIGLASCAKIMEQHGGTLTVAQTDTQFSVKATFPL